MANSNFIISILIKKKKKSKIVRLQLILLELCLSTTFFLQWISQKKKKIYANFIG